MEILTVLAKVAMIPRSFRVSSIREMFIGDDTCGGGEVGGLFGNQVHAVHRKLKLARVTLGQDVN